MLVYDIDQRAHDLTVQLLRDRGYSEDRIARILEEKDFRHGDVKSVMYAESFGPRVSLRGEEHGFSIKK